MTIEVVFQQPEQVSVARSRASTWEHGQKHTGAVWDIILDQSRSGASRLVCCDYGVFTLWVLDGIWNNVS